jgi:CHASE2 domain-containing sensor protein
MSRLVVLKIGEGSFEQGFPVILQISEEGNSPATPPPPPPTAAPYLIAELTGKLPPRPDLPSLYQRWQQTYRRLGMRSRLNAPTTQETNVSTLADCQKVATALSDRFNQWLRAESFRLLREKWLEKLSPDNAIRVILQTENRQLQQLPWHLWDLLDRYPQAELALGAPMYERVVQDRKLGDRVRILAILGDSEGIDTEKDRRLLEQLPDAEVCFLVEPQRQELSDRLWERPWDILFFAGHSSSRGTTGQIQINKSDSLSLGELRHALRKALAQGLQLAIFNSCDGLGLAQELADLQIPQIIVMREPVPDAVAQAFLKYFLTAFSQGEPLYSAVRQGRDRLQALEPEFAFATWLPVLYQNPAEFPPAWVTLHRPKVQPCSTSPLRPLIPALLTTGLVVGLRFLGFLQPLELMAFDQLMRLRPPESPDPRLLVVTISGDDIRQQESRGGSLTDSTLQKLLAKIIPAQPRAIGLDVYRDAAVAPQYKQLAQQFKQTPNLVGVCKISDSSTSTSGIAPPPELPPEQVGFSDFLEDSDGVLRRHLMYMTVTDPTSPCTAPYAFNLQLAFLYLFAEGISPKYTAEGTLQLGKVTFAPLTANTGAYRGIDAGGGQVMLNYRSSGPAAVVSLTQVLNGQVRPDAFKNRVVLVGVTEPSFGDYWTTPYGSGPNEKVPGVLLQAQMVSQILSAVLDGRSLLWSWSEPVEILWIVVWGSVGGVLAWQFKSIRWWLLSLSLATGVLAIACFGLLLQAGWVPLVPPLLALVVSSTVVRTVQRHSGEILPS